MKFYEIKYTLQGRPNNVLNPGSAFASTDIGKMIGLSSGYLQLLSTVSTGIGLYTYDQFGVLRGLPDGTCTAKSTQRVVYTPIQVGDVLKCIMSSNFSTSGTPATSSDVGKTVGLTGNAPLFVGLSTAGTLLTQGPIRGIIRDVPSTQYVNVQITGINVIKMTTA
jgi:hypothetical protein